MASWEWRDDNGWKRYDRKTESQLERAFTIGNINVRLKHGFFAKTKAVYHVDMSKKSFYQINVNTGMKRDVRRKAPRFGRGGGGGGGGRGGRGRGGRKIFFQSGGFLGGTTSVGGGSVLSGTGASTAKGPYWSWKDDYAWKSYPLATSNEIEYAFTVMGVKDVSLTTGFFSTRPNYKVIFHKNGMWQENTHTRFRRQVRRHEGSSIQYTPEDVKEYEQMKKNKGVSKAPQKKKNITNSFGELFTYVSKKFSYDQVTDELEKSTPALLPKGKPLIFDETCYVLGSGATKTRPPKKATQPEPMKDAHSVIANILKESVKDVTNMRGQRGERSVTQMLQAAYSNGLFMLGGANSPVNSLVRPALRHVLNWCAQQKPSDPKRRHILTTLAEACLDCQQVQAREMLRLHRELTNQAQTLFLQVQNFLNPFKENAIDSLITLRHGPLCDKDHRHARPWQQRPHLRSAYVAMAGDFMAMDDTLPSKNDRFLHDAKKEVSKICETTNGVHIAKELMEHISVPDFFNGLLSDINNQSKTADRSIDAKCIFSWAKDCLKNPHVVFFDGDRKAEFKDQMPSAPLKENEYNVFLSKKVLVDILVRMKFLVEDSTYVIKKQVDEKEKPADTKASKVSVKSAETEKSTVKTEFEKWLSEEKLSDKSISALSKAGIKTKEELAKQDSTPLSFMKIGLSMGQARTVSKLTEKLQSKK